MGCFQAPEFSEIPKIKFHSLIYYDSITARQDALVLKFDFEDGDGNLGLRETETFVPYHSFDLIIDSRDSIVTYSDTEVVPPLFTVDFTGRVRPFDDVDNRPLFNNCDYHIAGDTFYISKNEFHENLHLTFEVKKNGQYSEIDFPSKFGNVDCSSINLNGRFGIFEEDNLGEPLTGTISYEMSYAINPFPIVFLRDTIRVSFYIYDRDLNKSNVVISPDFTLPSITEEIE
ncbi:MAG: hypothetical protein JXR10_05355 [Cyclobacteriaceae bacterium]